MRFGLQTSQRQSGGHWRRSAEVGGQIELSRVEFSQRGRDAIQLFEQIESKINRRRKIQAGREGADCALSCVALLPRMILMPREAARRLTRSLDGTLRASLPR